MNSNFETETKRKVAGRSATTLVINTAYVMLHSAVCTGEMPCVIYNCKQLDDLKQTSKYTAVASSSFA